MLMADVILAVDFPHFGLETRAPGRLRRRDTATPLATDIGTDSVFVCAVVYTTEDLSWSIVVSTKSALSTIQCGNALLTFCSFVLYRMAMSCEALAYADISGKLSVSKDRVFAEKLGFVLLDVAGRSILELLAFCTVTAIWLKTAIESSPSVLWGSQTSAFGILPALFVVLILLLVLTSATLSVIALVVYQKDTLDTIQEHPWGRARTMLEAIAWGVHGLVVLECLFVTSQRVLNCVPAAQLSQRLSLLRKAVLPMLVASLVYLVRSFWLLAVFWHTNAIDRGTWAWWIGFAWLPTWLAVGFLLYSARKRDQLPSSEEIEQPLLLPARPPAEAFLAFSQHRQGLDIDDSFSFCRSPITHVVAHPDDLEVADEETLSAGSGAAAANQI